MYRFCWTFFNERTDCGLNKYNYFVKIDRWLKKKMQNISIGVLLLVEDHKSCRSTLWGVSLNRQVITDQGECLLTVTQPAGECPLDLVSNPELNTSMEGNWKPSCRSQILVHDILQTQWLLGNCWLTEARSLHFLFVLYKSRKYYDIISSKLLESIKLKCLV